MTVTIANPIGALCGAFVLFEGLPPTVIDSQVLTHVRLVREILGIDLAVIAFACTADIHAQSAAALEHARKTAGGDVLLFRGIRPALPGSLAANRRRLNEALGQVGEISLLHARGDYAAAVTGPLALSKALPMLWDCRGDSRAELRERIGMTSPLRRLPLAVRAWMSQQDSIKAGKTSAAACFVSQALRDLMAGYIGSKPSWVLPCLADEDAFFFDAALRRRMRVQLGFGEGDPVYIYSGSLAGYQCFDEVVDTFKATLRLQTTARLMILTPYSDAARKKLAKLPADKVLCKAVGYSEVNSYLNAADYGFLLRDSTPVNHVAFPTKFAEYAMTGLQVIMKQSPPSCVTEARVLGNLLSLAEVSRSAALQPGQRAAIALLARERMGRRASIQRFAEIYQKLETLAPPSGS